MLTAGLLFWGGEVVPGAQMARTEPAMFFLCFGGNMLDGKNKPDSLTLSWKQGPFWLRLLSFRVQPMALLVDARRKMKSAALAQFSSTLQNGKGSECTVAVANAERSLLRCPHQKVPSEVAPGARAGLVRMQCSATQLGKRSWVDKSSLHPAFPTHCSLS